MLTLPAHYCVAYYTRHSLLCNLLFACWTTNESLTWWNFRFAQSQYQWVWVKIGLLAAYWSNKSLARHYIQSENIIWVEVVQPRTSFLILAKLLTSTVPVCKHGRDITFRWLSFYHVIVLLTASENLTHWQLFYCNEFDLYWLSLWCYNLVSMILNYYFNILYSVSCYRSCRYMYMYMYVVNVIVFAQFKTC